MLEEGDADILERSGLLLPVTPREVKDLHTPLVAVYLLERIYNL